MSDPKFEKKHTKLIMIFKKNAKRTVTTIPFTSSLFESLYYSENVMDYDFNSLINEI